MENLSSDYLSAIVNSVRNRSLVVADLNIPTGEIVLPPRLPFMILALVTEGEISMGIDLVDYSACAGSIIMASSRNAMTYFSAKTESVIRCLMMEPRISESMVSKLSSMIPIMMRADIRPVIQLDDTEVAKVNAWMQLASLVSEDLSPMRAEILNSLVSGFHMQVMEIISAHTQPKNPQTRSRKEEMMAKFLILISRHFRYQHSVGFYASELCVTSKHLSTVVRAISGKTPNYWISLHLLSEAQFLLRTTDKTIQEISVELHFPTQSQFGRFFRAKTGQSPGDYKKSASVRT